MKYYLITALLFLGIIALSWGVTALLVWLICLCFSWEFNFLIATGVWLIYLFIKSLFDKTKKIKRF